MRRAARRRTIRILVLSNLYPPHHLGGYELRCQSVVDRLRRGGQDVRVLTGRFRRPGAIDRQPHVLRRLVGTWGPPFPPEDLAGLLSSEAANRGALAEAIRDWGPDIVDIWGMEFIPRGVVATALTCGVPVHLTLEDTWLLDGWRRDSLDRLTSLAERLHVLIPPSMARLGGASHLPLEGASIRFVSEALKTAYADGGFKHSAARVRVAGIDMTPFGDASTHPPPPPFVIVTVGQLTEPRGQADLIAAVACVAAGRESCPLVVRIVGGGNPAYVAELERRARECAHSRLRFEFVGAVDPQRVAALYRGHLFVHTSRLPEGLPRVLMEAMAAGLPVIATNTGGQKDILQDGRWGCLVPPAQPQALAAAISDAMQDLPGWQSRAGAAREFALRRYDLNEYVAGHVEDLQKAASRRPSFTKPGVASWEPAAARLASFIRRLGDAAADTACGVDVVADPEYAWHLGVALKRTSRLAESASLFEQLLAMRDGVPDHTRRATFHLAELALVGGDWRRAAALLRDCLAVSPDHIKAAYDLRYAERRRTPRHLRGLMSGCRGRAMPVCAE